MFIRVLELTVSTLVSITNTDRHKIRIKWQQ